VTNLHDVLVERGLVAQTTDEAIAERLAEPRVAYVGFDPTADSLHVGSLVPLMGLAWLQRCGHKPIALLGGATGLIGDPSGKTEARRLLDRETIAGNARAIGAQIRNFVDFGESATGAELVDNLDWLGELRWIDLLREVGACLSVNRMLTMESVRTRLEGDGISFLEFNYMVLQAYDFLHLHRSRGCTVQVGGQDQWGNIVMGIELGRRLEGADLAGVTMPLVTKSDGSKFGKSESGNVWLSAERTPPYEFYQFWRNVDDADVGRYLRFFTFLPVDQIRRHESAEGVAINRAKEVLAYEVTRLVHGDDAADRAQEDSRRAFGAARDVGGESIPHAILAGDELESGIGLLTLMVRAGLASSNGEARRLVQGGGVRIHDRRIEDPRATVDTSQVRDGFVLLRVGKRKLYRFDVE